MILTYHRGRYRSLEKLTDPRGNRHNFLTDRQEHLKDRAVLAYSLVEQHGLILQYGEEKRKKITFNYII